MKIKVQAIYKEFSLQRLVMAIMLAFCVVAAAKNIAYSQSNSYFGTNASDTTNSAGSGGVDYSHDQPEDSNPNSALPGLNSTTQGNPPPTGTDFTGDEKRMQKKYKENLAHANSLIAKGTQMMKSSEKNQNSPAYKRGKILKEIGEKSLAELKANNPYPGQKPPK